MGVVTRPRLRKLAFWTGGLVACYALVGFLVAPPIVRGQLEKMLGEQLGRKVSIEQVRINPFRLSASVRNFSLKEQDGSTTAAGFEELSVDLALSSLFRFGVIVEAVELAKPYARVVRYADGRYSFQDIVEKLTSGPAAPPGPVPRFAVYNIQVRDGRIDFDDQPEKTAHAVTDLQIGVPFISSLPAEIDIRVAPRLSAKVNGTPFEIAGETAPFKDRHVATVRVDIDDLELARYLKYSPVPLRIRVPSGRLNTRLVLTSTAVPGNRIQTLILSGTASLDRLRVRQADGTPLFGLARLSVDLGGVDLLRQRATITGLRIDAPELDVARQKDGSLALLAALPAAPAAPRKKASEPPFTFMIEQIALSNGTVRFVDRVPDKPVTLALTELSVYVEGLGNAPGNSAALKVRGRIGRAPLEITGTLASLPDGLALDLKASAQEIDLAPLSPYSVRYAGHAIEKGKLSLKHAYVIKDRKVTAQNNIYLDEFTFGERVDSPTATKLPVALAVSLLKDPNGVIDLNVPVSGALDDPQISIREVMATAFRAPLEKAASAPFALLGSQFGAGEELAYLEFSPGSATLDAGQEAKLRTLAKALHARPGLKLEISGRVDPDADGATLKRAAQERQAKAEKLKEGKAAAAPVADVAIAESDFRLLANSRAQATKLWLVETGRLAPERIFVVAPGMSAEGIKDKGRPTRADFTLK